MVHGDIQHVKLHAAKRSMCSLGPRPSPLRDLLRAFNCAGEGNI